MTWTQIQNQAARPTTRRKNHLRRQRRQRSKRKSKHDKKTKKTAKSSKPHRDNTTLASSDSKQIDV